MENGILLFGYFLVVRCQIICLLLDLLDEIEDLKFSCQGVLESIFEEVSY